MEIPYTVANRRDTGLYNAKVGIWLFLASEVMLFGGLFSGYVFLRAGVQPGIDIPWPSAYEVHGKFVWLGFTNTLVLIASSVFVVMAWAQLKLRNWSGYSFYMVLVLLCSAAFMGIKTIEYNSKLNHHFGVRLTDGTLMDGSLAYDEVHDCEGDVVTFKADKASFSLVPTGITRTTDPYFLDFAKEENVEFDAKFYTAVAGDSGLTFEQDEEPRRIALADVKQEMDAHRKELLAAANADAALRKKELEIQYREAESDQERYALRKEIMAVDPVPLPGAVNAEVVGEGATFQFKRKDVLGRNISETRIPFFRGNAIEGTLVDAAIDLEVHSLDFQMVPDDSTSMAWNYLDEGFKAGYQHHKEEVRKKHQDWVEKGGVIPAHELRVWQHIHPLKEHGGEKAAGKGGHHDYEIIQVTEEDTKFSSSHGPAFGPYYAIYFTMTGLHGLHVVGGALVLGYFLFFGKKLYRKNPEHLANRVEVGGLFWHFVDLVWIFLFPIFYLM